MTRTTVDIEIRPLTGALGAEVRGVDLRGLDDAEWARICALWLEYLVLFFPGQDLSPSEHIALGRRLGEIEVHPFLRKHPDHGEIVVLDTNGGGIDFWHTDVTFSSTPPIASILQMKLCAATGGDTMFTNQYLIYEQLSAPIRALLEGLTAVHTAAVFGHPEKQSEHPVVRVHPETGRRSLFINRGFTAYFPQLRPGESDALLAYLCQWSEQPRFQCRYRWEEGSVGMWDNRCTQHNAVGDYSDRRTIERVTVLGDVPQGPTARWAVFEAGKGEVALSHSAIARRSAP